MTIKLLSAKELQPSTLPQSIQFTTTAEIDDFEGVLGQSRAIEALHFSMGIGHTGYNLYVLGASGTGKHTVVDRFISELAQDKQIPNDWCYIHNFKNPQQPIALELPPGKAIKLRIDMDHLLEELIHMIPSAFETETYQKQIDDIQFKLESKQNKVLSKVKKQAEKQSMQLVRTPTGYQFSPIHEGETISDENFELLPKEIQNKYSENIEKLEKELKSKVQQFSQWQRDSRESSKSLNRQTTVTCINPLIQDLNDKWTDYTEVLQYFETIQEDVVLNVSDFLPSDDDPQTSFTNSQSASHPIFRKYKVNVITDHSESVGAPIIYEDNPSLINIIGNTEYISEYGSLTTDSLLIKPGALHKANGGYLILDADKLMMHDFSWESLKRALKTQKIRIESLEKMYSYNSTVTLDPESIPLSIKVVLIGDRELHYLFSEHDEDYCKLFRVSADF
ncbi:MAG: AAA family ATPase, partial [Methylococcales bacterium]|nr:AAA family ATPase [Methylococcales bacterium]